MRLMALAICILWSVLLGWGLIWNLQRTHEGVIAMAQVQARKFCQKMLAYRHWNALHGGIYVEVGDQMQPNPYLEGIKERDVVTPSGRTLTLVNPASMLREIIHVEQSLFGMSGRITSLLPINPNNRPDAWEQKALMKLQQGEKEVFSIFMGTGDSHLRMMQPIHIEDKCLDCHQEHGYQQGDLRGGISTRISLSPLLDLGRTQRWGMITGTAFLWVAGLIAIWGGCCRFFRSKEKRQQAEERLEYLDRYDPLTGLANQDHFIKKLNLFLDSYRDCDAVTMSVVLIEIDAFRQTNQTLGHEHGNRLLEGLARRLRSVVGEHGTAAHFGGGVFALFLPFVRQTAEIDGVCRRALKALTDPLWSDGHHIHSSAHAGIAVFPNDGSSGKLLLQNAQIALNAAQSDGNPLSPRYFSAALGEQAREQARFKKDIHRALMEEEFFLQYQPQYDIQHRLVGAEALLRWRHPQCGLVSPSRFIPLAEASGMMNDLARWTLKTVCRQIRSWHDSGWQNLPPIAVNLSAEQFRQPELALMISEILKDENVPPSALMFEITESTLMHDVQKAMVTMWELKKLGTCLAVDDFGTGYSSLSYLKDFPLECLKIDQSFVQNICTDSKSAAITSAIVAMSQSLGLRVLAEGVEEERQLSRLQHLGCCNFQGYYFSRPVDAIDFETFLKRSQTFPALKAQ